MSEPERAFSVFVPPELEAGVYANFLLAWHSGHEFTLDFFVSRLPAETEEEIPYRLVSRVRLPVTLIFDTLRKLNDAVTSYENEFGEIRRLDS